VENGREKPTLQVVFINYINMISYVMNFRQFPASPANLIVAELQAASLFNCQELDGIKKDLTTAHQDSKYKKKFMRS
jgi:hypothetical protein